MQHFFIDVTLRLNERLKQQLNDIDDDSEYIEHEIHPIPVNPSGHGKLKTP